MPEDRAGEECRSAYRQERYGHKGQRDDAVLKDVHGGDAEADGLLNDRRERHCQAAARRMAVPRRASWR